MSGSNLAVIQTLTSQHNALHLQQPQQPKAAGTPGSSKSVSFDDVSRLFTFPIAEAATSLGVCTSVLKRICRANGITRWPYRQFLAGKTMEDIQREAAIEKSRGLSEFAKVAKSTSTPVTITQPNFGTHPQVKSITHALSLESSNLSGAVPAPHLQANKPQTERNNTNAILQYHQPHNIPSFFDEFRYGFPSTGLSHCSNKWWGSGDGGRLDIKEKNRLLNGDLNCMDHKIVDVRSQSASKLVSLRRKNVKDGRESLRLGVVKRHGPYKLNSRERTILQQAFLVIPSQWK